MFWRSTGGAEWEYVPRKPLARALFFVSLLAFMNTAQCFLASRSPQALKESNMPLIYALGVASGQVTPLTARLMGMWNLMSGTIRMYTAYNMGEGGAYKASFYSFVAALAHFVSEAAFFGTAKFTSPGIFTPIAVAGVMSAWMALSAKSYIGHVYQKPKKSPKKST